MKEVKKEYIEMFNDFWETRQAEYDSLRYDFFTEGLEVMKNGKRRAWNNWKFDIDDYCAYHKIEIPTQKDFDNCLIYCNIMDLQFTLDDLNYCINEMQKESDLERLEEILTLLEYMKEDSKEIEKIAAIK